VVSWASQERQGQQGESCILVPTDPASCLVFIQAALPLGRLNVLLDSPSRGAYLRHFGQWHFRRGIRAMALQLWLLPQ